MNHQRSRAWMTTTAMALALASVTSLAHAQRTRRRGDTAPAPAKKGAERASGVILKVEPIAKASSVPSSEPREDAQRVRLTINTAAVWRDWARDQESESGRSSAKKEARDGSESVATKGEPRAPESLVVVDLEPNGKVQTRFRAADDETSKGSHSAAAASGNDPDPASQSSRTRSRSSEREPRRTSAKPIHFTAKDLKPGLFVEVDYHHRRAQNIIDTVAVIRPITPGERPAKPSTK
jgi:hypothetical protein